MSARPSKDDQEDAANDGHETVVREIAASMGFLDDAGVLKKLDSLALIDFVVALEEASQMSIPTAALRMDVFESVSSIAAMLRELAE